MTCSNLPNVKNGQIDAETKKTFKEELKIVCDRGFTLAMSSPVVCQEDGAWSEGSVWCEPVQCALYNDPSPVTVDVEYDPDHAGADGVLTGGQAQFSCGEGFSIHGPTSAVCLEDGTWSAELPQCQSK